MVERWTLPFDFGGSEMTPAPGGEFVSYADYEAAERKVAELEVEIDRTKLHCSAWEDSARINKAERDAAEAREARLSEALRNVRADCQSPIDLYHRVGPSFTSPGGDEYEPASYVMDKMQELITRIDAALSGSGSGWPVPDGWKLVPVEPTEAMYRAVYKEQDDSAIHNYGASPTFDDYWAVALEAAPLPAAPQQGGE